MYYLAHNRLHFVAQRHHVVTVPADGAADVQHDAGHDHKHRREFIRYDFGRVKMAAVQAEPDAFRNGVAQIELVRADYVALRAQAEQFAFERVEIVAAIDGHGKDLVERLGQQTARRLPVDRRVLQAVGNPDVRHTGRS